MTLSPKNLAGPFTLLIHPSNRNSVVFRNSSFLGETDTYEIIRMVEHISGKSPMEESGMG
jgi:hypothetical protein